MPPRRAPGSAWGLTILADDWRHRAACRNEDPELFFPIGTSGPALLQVEQAKAVCRRCPVSAECLTWAMDRPEEYGIWGGLTEGERRALRAPKAPPRRPRSDRPPQPCGTPAAYRRHLRRGEPIDDACRAGHNRAAAESRRRDRQRQRERVSSGGAAGVGGGGMTPQEIRELLEERFGPLEELERERRRLSPAREIARRRRLLAEAMGDVPGRRT